MLFILLLADLKSERLFVKFSELLAINLEISSDVSERLLVKFEKSSILDFSSFLFHHQKGCLYFVVLFRRFSLLPQFVVELVVIFDLPVR